MRFLWGHIIKGVNIMKIQWDDKTLVIVAAATIALISLWALPPEMASKTVDGIIVGLFGVAVGRATA